MKIFQCIEQAFMFNYFRSKDTLIDLKTNVIKLHEAPNSKKREIFFLSSKRTQKTIINTPKSVFRGPKLPELSLIT